MKNELRIHSTYSSLYVSPLFPARGESVTIRCTAETAPDKVILKYETDEGVYHDAVMKADGYAGGRRLYSATVPVTHDSAPFTWYFAFIHEGRSGFYSKRGMTRHTPAYGDRFTLLKDSDAPEWVAGSTCYQIFPDRFNNGDSTLGAKRGEWESEGVAVQTPAWNSEPGEWSETHCVDFYNGDLRGIWEKIDHLEELGVNAVYINPVFASRSVHRYDTVSFEEIDSKLGGDEAYSTLIGKLHERGIRVIQDISINHTGTEAVWLRKAREDKDSEEHGYYYFLRNGKVACWQDVPTLPQLRYSSPSLRDRMYRGEGSVMKKYLSPPYGIDGWRLDVSPETGRRGKEQLCQELWRDIRKELKGVRRDLYLVGEDWDDSAPYLEGDMWDGTMNYYGAGRPLRSWMGQRDMFLSPGHGHSRVHEEPWTGDEVAAAINDAIDSQRGAVPFFQMNLFDSHDTDRLHNDSDVYDSGIYRGVVMAMYLLPGMPSLYYGDEVGLRGRLGSNEGARFPMEWDSSRWDGDVFEVFRTMGRIRKTEWLAWASWYVAPMDEKAFIVLRYSSSEAFLALVNRGEERMVELPYIPFRWNRSWIEYGDGTVWTGSDGSMFVDFAKNESILMRLEAQLP